MAFRHIICFIHRRKSPLAKIGRFREIPMKAGGKSLGKFGLWPYFCRKEKEVCVKLLNGQIL